jgi:16S rRNA (guanine(966)-N(2))-methyltransferase RsmD
MRETLFNIIAPEIEGVVFLDAYAGTGAVGIEALSRGASRAIFIERSRAAAAVIRDNLSTLALTNRAEVLQGKVLQYLTQRTAEIIFLDPPYEEAKEYREALTILGAGSAQLVIVQHASRFALEDHYGRLERNRILKQGDNSLSFYRIGQDS